MMVDPPRFERGTFRLKVVCTTVVLWVLKLAGGQGLEPRLAESKSADLPLIYPPMVPTLCYDQSSLVLQTSVRTTFTKSAKLDNIAPPLLLCNHGCMLVIAFSPHPSFCAVGSPAFWSAWQDSNLRSPDSKSGMLTRLHHTQKLGANGWFRTNF